MSPQTVEGLKQQLTSRIPRLTKYMAATNNSGYYLITDLHFSSISDFDKILPLEFPRYTKQQYLESTLNLLTYVIRDYSENVTSTPLSFRNHNSQILRREMEGVHNLIFSSDNEDIVNTIEILSESYNNSIRNFKLLARNELLTNSPTLLFTNPVESIERISKVLGNYASAKLMNDNFYAFSYNQSLLNLDIKDLKKLPGVRLKYIQVDSMNKCVP